MCAGSRRCPCLAESRQGPVSAASLVVFGVSLSPSPWSENARSQLLALGKEEG